jgi:hypothetical protein
MERLRHYGFARPPRTSMQLALSNGPGVVRVALVE